MDKKTISLLKQLADVVIEEAKQNEAFGNKIEQILGILPVEPGQDTKACKTGKTGRSTNRRDPAVLDPVAVISEGENILLEKLGNLTDKELKDIIADYSMDPSKLAMRWRKKEKLIDLIMEAARRRASKGDAFRA